MRSVDLALYADTLAGEAAALAARVERERGRVRLFDIERAAIRELPVPVVDQLREHGLLATRADVERVIELQDTLDAIEQLRAWVEERLRDRAAV